MLLQVVTNTRDVSGDFDTVGKTDSGNLTKCGVRLLRGSSLNSSADTALLGRILIDSNSLLGVPTLQQCRRLCLFLGNCATCVNQLVKCGPIAPPYTISIYVMRVYIARRTCAYTKQYPVRTKNARTGLFYAVSKAVLAEILRFHAHNTPFDIIHRSLFVCQALFCILCGSFFLKAAQSGYGLRA